MVRFSVPITTYTQLHAFLSRQFPSFVLFNFGIHLPPLSLLLYELEIMVVAQQVKESEITEQDSLLLTRNLLRIAIFNISYIRGLFPEKYFSDKSVPALEMKIKKLMPIDAESRRLIDWMEKGVYDALQKKYLRTLLFCVCETVEGPMIEEYAFSFSYSNSDSQDVLMNINRTGNKKGGAFKCNSTTEVTPNQMRSSACKMVRTLIQLMRTLDKMPKERIVLMKLFYYDDVTPVDYEPPFFRSCTEQEGHNSWTKNPLKMEVGNVNSKHFVLALKVKSVLDPCEDENDDLEDDDVSLGADSVRDEYSESDIDISPSPANEYLMVPIDKQHAAADSGTVSEADTEDPMEDEQQLGRVKGWISCYHLDSVELTDVFSNFHDISAVLIEEIMGKLVKDGTLSKSGTDSYTINKQKEKFDYGFDPVKDEIDAPDGKKAKQGSVEDHMYMKALYHALPMNYISIAKLQSKLEEVNQTTARKLIDKMTCDGYLEAKRSGKLGKRVIHSDLTKKKLMEVRKSLDSNAMDLDINESHNVSNHVEVQKMGSNPKDMSTCGVLQSIGSDLTRTRGRSETIQNGSIRTEQTVSMAKGHGNTPISRAEPVTSGESFAQGKENERVNGSNDQFDDPVIGSRSTQGKQSRKASTVKEPILQHMKRQKSQSL